MGLITLFIAFILPHYMIKGTVFNTARKLLGGGTLLVSAHFIVQYILHKHVTNLEEIRTIINLLFGIPISYLVNMSYLYLQHKGTIDKQTWGFAPIACLLNIIVIAFAIFIDRRMSTVHFATLTMALLYATTLIYYSILQLRKYVNIKKVIKEKNDPYYVNLVKWTKWSMFILGAIGWGFPIMTFNTNLLMRSLYGLLSISAAFFYILCFIGYGLSGSSIFSFSVNHEENDNEDQKKPYFNENKQERITSAVNEFIQKERYLQTGITLKDAAIDMGISCNMLKLWLHTTPYVKFSNWIVSLRIEKSKELLVKYPDLNSEEIAEKCGFCDRQYFQRQFTKQVGISPSKWIKERQFDQLKSMDITPASSNDRK